jgi:hypothetical protein
MRRGSACIFIAAGAPVRQSLMQRLKPPLSSTTRPERLIPLGVHTETYTFGTKMKCSLFRYT